MRQRAAKIMNFILTCDAAMKVAVGDWRTAVAQGNPEAFDFLQRAVRWPYRIQSRIQDAVDRYGAPTVNQWLSDNNCPSLGQIQTYLQPLLDYSDLLRDRYQLQGWTEEQIATDIETTREDLDPEQLPWPGTYTDDL